MALFIRKIVKISQNWWFWFQKIWRQFKDQYLFLSTANWPSCSTVIRKTRNFKGYWRAWIVPSHPIVSWIWTDFIQDNSFKCNNAVAAGDIENGCYYLMIRQIAMSQIFKATWLIVLMMIILIKSCFLSRGLCYANMMRSIVYIWHSFFPDLLIHVRWY